MYRSVIFGLLGGLGLLLYGMSLMGDGLQRAAGDRMRKVLEALTGKVWKGVIVGAAVTAAVQSSSATTVMLVSFVNAGMMTLNQAFGVIMGANIGTTLTPQIIAFRLTDWALPAIGIGFLIRLVGKRRSHRHFGSIVLGFGLLFLGMDVMAESVGTLSDSPVFADWMASLSHNPLLGVLVGTVVTAVIQSSAATIGIILALATQGLITLDAAIPVLFGCNIGTCATAILASIGTNRTARRTAMAHVLFNAAGSIIFIILLRPFTAAVQSISQTDSLPRLIANAHSLFNVANTVVWLPLTGVMVRLVTSIVRGPDVEIAKDARYLDHRMLENPSVALRLAVKEMTHMADLAKQMLLKTRQALFDGTTGVLDEVDDLEDKVDSLKDQIIVYLSTLVSQRALTEHQSSTLAGLMHAISDIERVADHVENIAGYAREKSEKSLPFSETAIAELTDIYDRVVELFDISVDGLATWDRSKLDRVWEFEDAIDDLQEDLRNNHIIRLNKGTCYPGSGVVFIEVINNLERMADHCINIAEVVFEHKGPPSFDGKASREHASGLDAAGASD
ncbi:MAG: Na/Pi cotransporter family protein [Firmicutes bacterium]|nr:Na/Pi cotransporter family protein [Bacillota bacterium]